MSNESWKQIQQNLTDIESTVESSIDEVNEKIIDCNENYGSSLQQGEDLFSAEDTLIQAIKAKYNVF